MFQAACPGWGGKLSPWAFPGIEASWALPPPPPSGSRHPAPTTSRPDRGKQTGKGALCLPIRCDYFEVVDSSGAITLRALTNLLLALKLSTNQVSLLWGRWPIWCLHWSCWPIRCDYSEVVYRSGCLHLKLLTNEVRARKCSNFQPVVGIRIRILRIRMFLGLPDPHPDPLVTITDPDSSIIKNSLENLDFYYFLISLWLLRVMYQCSESGSYVFRPTGSASGSVLKCHGSPTLVPTVSCDHWGCLTNQAR